MLLDMIEMDPLSRLGKGMVAALSRQEEVCTTKLNFLVGGSSLDRLTGLRNTTISEDSRMPYSCSFLNSSSSSTPEQKRIILLMGVLSMMWIFSFKIRIVSVRSTSMLIFLAENFTVICIWLSLLLGSGSTGLMVR